MGEPETCCPTFQKKLIRVTDAPQMTAAPHEMSTPSLPRPARCGFDEFDPNPHTIAEMISASTERMSPTVMTAPTMVRNCAIPGRPESFGVMSMSIGRTAAIVVMSSNTMAPFA